MLAILLTVAVFLLFSLIGSAALSRPSGLLSLRELLLAPVLGMATTVLAVFFLSRLGLAADSFARPLTLALALFGCLVLYRLRPRLGLRRYLPFAALLAAALFLTGRPMLEFGFHWVSYCNDDMANYCLSANRLVHHGFADVPQASELLKGQDYSQEFWFWHAVAGARPGVDLLLAWLVSLTGLSAHQVFMPLILAFHLTLISAAGAVVCRGEEPSEDSRLAKWTCALLAASALTTLGAVYQLLAQVAGLSLLAGCAALLLRPFGTEQSQKDSSVPGAAPFDSGVRSAGAWIRQAITLGVLISSMLIVYPEVFPFLGLSFVAYEVVTWRRRTLSSRVREIAVAGVVVGLLLNVYLLAVFRFLCHQATTGTRGSLATEIFPFYLIPSGLANLWGFFPLSGQWPREPWLSCCIVLGGTLLLVAAAAALWLARKGQPAAIVVVVMMPLAGFLFVIHHGFGLFKLAMYAQPFLLGSLVTCGCRYVRPVSAGAVILAALGAAGLWAQAYYVEASRGTGVCYMEIPDPSRQNLVAQLERMGSQVHGQRVATDVYNISLGKFLLLYLRGTECALPSLADNFLIGAQQLPPSRFDDIVAGFYEQYADKTRSCRFNLHEPANPDSENPFTLIDIGPAVAHAGHVDVLLSGTCKASILNRWHGAAEKIKDAVRIEPWARVHNRLVFQQSKLGVSYCSRRREIGRVSLNGLEPDLLYAGQTMSGCGRHFLFRVLQPTATMRFRLELTTYYQADGDNRLPPAVAIGADRADFPMLGRGSACVFSAPFAPQQIDGAAFVAIDMGKNGKPFPERRSGAMAWYNRDVRRDGRYLVGFARDISLVSEDEYARLQPPEKLERFPADLRHRDLEYSGIFEDGWTAEESFCCLTRPERPSLLSVRGEVPLLTEGFSTEVHLLLDGVEIARRVLNVGDFALAVPVPAGPAKTRIDLRFSTVLPLPNGDGRPVAARLTFIGFDNPAESSAVE